MHFADEYIHRITFWRTERCLCLNGGADENRSLTRNPDRVDCPNCLAIMELAKSKGISLKDMAGLRASAVEFINREQ